MRAFSLAEVLLSVFFVFLLMLALFTLLPSSAWMVAQSRQELQADSLARGIIEDYRSRGFANVPMGIPAPAPPPETYQGVVFTPTVEVKALPGSPDAKLSKRVQVAIRWEVRGIARQLQREAWLVNVTKN